MPFAPPHNFIPPTVPAHHPAWGGADFFRRGVKLDDGGWSLADTQRQLLLAKIRAAGVPLGEYVNGKIFYGIKTGLNEAFVIDAATRDRLIAEDPRSAEIIKPFLAGRDIKRYEPLKTERWLIFARRVINIKEYPAIEKHLLQFKQQLMPKSVNMNGKPRKGRKPGSRKRYDLQDSIDYWREFEKPKPVLPAIVNRTSFMVDAAGWYFNDKTSIIATDDLYLLGLLNSSALDFVMRLISSTKQGGYFETKPMYVSQLPIIADPPADTRNKIEQLVGAMLDTKRALSLAHTDRDLKFYASKCATLDREIDALVWGLYGVEEGEGGGLVQHKMKA